MITDLTGNPVAEGVATQAAPQQIQNTNTDTNDNTNPVSNAPQQQQQQTAPQPTDQQTQQEAVKEIVKDAGLDFDAIAAEYKANGGQLPTETYEKVVSGLEAKGISKAYIDSYFTNLNAAEQLFVRDVYQITGGEENYNEMAAWAQENLTPQALKAFSDMAEAGNAEQGLLAVEMLYNQYQASTREGGNRVTSTNGSLLAQGSYRSKDEYYAAIADPRYATDPDYQQSVQRRAEISYLNGTLK